MPISRKDIAQSIVQYTFRKDLADFFIYSYKFYLWMVRAQLS
jgi:hypothetical protein